MGPSNLAAGRLFAMSIASAFEESIVDAGANTGTMRNVMAAQTAIAAWQRVRRVLRVRLME